MPNKEWSNLKDSTSRRAAGDWARALNIPDLKSSEWQMAARLSSEGMSDAEIRREILSNR